MLFWKAEQSCKGYSDGKIIWSPADFVRLPWQRNDQSIILMVGLFEQWETEQQQKNPEKHISKKL